MEQGVEQETINEFVANVESLKLQILGMVGARGSRGGIFLTSTTLATDIR